MISSTLRSTPLLTSTVFDTAVVSLCWWIEINAYSVVHAQVCAKPLSVFVTTPAGSSAPVAGSNHLISNGPDLTLCSLTVFGDSALALTRATITTSEDPPTNQRYSLLLTPSASTLNGEAMESVATMLGGMERLRKLLDVHKATTALASGGRAQTISTEDPLAASIALTNGEGTPASSLRMTGLFSACSAIHAASCCQPSA